MALREQIAQQTYSQTDDYEPEDDDRLYITRSPSSARRYQPPSQPQTFQRQYTHSQPPGKPAVQRRSLAPGSYTQGDTRLNVHYGAPPATKGRTIRDTEEPQAVPRRKRHLHPLLYLGIGMLGMLLLWIGLTALVSWGQWELNNLSYGMPRTYQIDGVINQNGDSAINPTHIIFLNLNRKIEVIVQPAGDASKAQIYVVTTLIEEGSEL